MKSLAKASVLVRARTSLTPIRNSLINCGVMTKLYGSGDRKYRSGLCAAPQ